MSDPYILSCDDAIHTADVKMVAADPSGAYIVSASRDRTSRLIAVGASIEAEESHPVMNTINTFVGHEQFVNFALYHPCVPFLDGEACVVTGANDKHIIFWNANTGAMEAVLDGHSDGVRSGTLMTPSNDLVTTGWDGTALVWEIASGRLKSAFTAHTTSVLCCVQVDHTKNHITTGSGDKTLITWDADTTNAITVHKGHIDSVQAVCRIDDLRFASGANDGQILLWTPLSPQPIARVGTHESIVFSLSWNMLTAELVSASEDRSVQVWNIEESGEGTTVQSIQFPCTVWSVTVAANGDLFTASSDGHIRGWSRDGNRAANADLIVAFDTEATAQMIDVKSAAAAGHSIDMTNMPDVGELEAHVGQKEGERKMFKTEGGLVEMYVWTSGRWEKLGTVVSGPDGEAYSGPKPRAKQTYMGQQYDYLFDLELGGEYTKVPYNRGQSIFDAAQDFINNNGHMGVSQGHKEEIQKFILDNIDPADAALLGGGGNTNAAPNAFAFSAFAQESAALAAQGGQAAMSWNEARQKMESKGQDVAFSTFAKEGQEAKEAANRGAPSAAASSSPTQDQGGLLPTAPIRFDAVSAGTIKTKIQQLCDGSTEFDNTVDSLIALSGKVGKPGLAEDEEESVLTCVCALYAALGEGNRYPAIDLLRYLASTPAGAKLVSSPAGICSDLLNEVLLGSSAFDGLKSDPERIVTLRLMANLLSHPGTLEPTIVTPAFLSMASPCVRYLRTTPNAGLKSGLLALFTNAALSVPSDVWDADEGSASKAFAKAAGEAVLFERDSQHQAKIVLAVVMAVSFEPRSQALEPRSQALVSALRTTLGTFITSSRKAACRYLSQAANLLHPFIKPSDDE